MIQTAPSRRQVTRFTTAHSNTMGQPMPRALVIATAAVVVGATVGCATATYQPSAQCAPPGGGEVRVLSALPEPGSYRVCGSINTFAPGIEAPERSVQAAIDEVRRFGGNAIVFTRPPTQAEHSLSKGYRREGGAIVIELR